MPHHKLRVIFLVQGEGRGHMTQAMSIFRYLREREHDILHVFMGSSARREIPEFFKSAIDAPIERLASPNFELDKDNKSLRVLPSILKNVRQGKKYFASIRRIQTVIDEQQPDFFINFYDMLGGLYQMIYGKRYKATQYLCIGHQYLAYHRDFPFAPGRRMEKMGFRILNWVTKVKADRILALSFSKYQDFKDSRFVVTPPLLRDAIKGQKTSTGNHILAYVVNDGYGKEILASYKNHPEENVVCFWDSKDHGDDYSPESGITFYQLNGEKFIAAMNSAKSYICTAGFESVCEAMYLSKPLMVVPVQKHYEQSCNALDAEKTGLCIASDTFDLEPLLSFSSKEDYAEKQLAFKQWVDSADHVLDKVFSN